MFLLRLLQQQSTNGGRVSYVCLHIASLCLVIGIIDGHCGFHRYRTYPEAAVAVDGGLAAPSALSALDEVLDVLLLNDAANVATT